MRENALRSTKTIPCYAEKNQIRNQNTSPHSGLSLSETNCRKEEKSVLAVPGRQGRLHGISAQQKQLLQRRLQEKGLQRLIY